MKEYINRAIEASKKNDPKWLSRFSEFEPYFLGLSTEDVKSALGDIRDYWEYFTWDERRELHDLYNEYLEYKTKKIDIPQRVDKRLFELFNKIMSLYSPNWLLLQREEDRVWLQIAEKALEYLQDNPDKAKQVAKIRRYEALCIRKLLEPETFSSELENEMFDCKCETLVSREFLDQPEIKAMYEYTLDLNHRVGQLITWRRKKTH